MDNSPKLFRKRNEGMTGKTIYHSMKALNTHFAANYRRGIGPTCIVLMLTTTGHKSGMPRVTPLQFEEVEGNYYIGSARGQAADWVKTRSRLG